jgi:nitroreductase
MRPIQRGISNRITEAQMSHKLIGTEIDQSVLELVSSRRSIYEFESDLPNPELVLQAIETACWAPNHKHTNPWRFYLLGDAAAASIVSCYKRLVEQKRGPETAALKGARWEKTPAWLVVTCVRSNDEFREREDYGACCCMIQNLALILWSAGIGLKWSTGPVTEEDAFFQATGIDRENELVVGLFGYGKPSEIPKASRPPVNQYVKKTS